MHCVITDLTLLHTASERKHRGDNNTRTYSVVMCRHQKTIIYRLRKRAHRRKVVYRHSDLGRMAFNTVSKTISDIQNILVWNFDNYLVRTASGDREGQSMF